MKHVHLVHLHQVQVVEDHSLGKEVARGIQHDGTVREAGEVLNLSTVDLVLKRTGREPSLYTNKDFLWQKLFSVNRRLIAT